MDSSQRINITSSSVPHPGELILEYLDSYGWSQSDLARRAGLTPKTISEICNGKAPISPATALAFEKVLKRPAHLWLNLQRLYDEAEARKQEFAKSLTWNDWAGRFPVKEMRQLKFSLPAGRTDADSLLSFFGVSSPESWRSVWSASSVAYRQTRNLKTREESIAAWVREAEIVAADLQLAEFDEHKLRSSVDELRRLTRKPADKIMDPLQNICASVGIAVVLVPELHNTGISGCVRWLSDKSVLLGLTLRYKMDDQFWFTFFHECGHILLHRKRSFIIDNAAEDLTDPIIDPEMQRYEAEANRFSADTLIPPSILGEFIRRESFTNESIYEFAEMIGVAPGIVIGRLQHDGVLARHQGNKLKQKLSWAWRP